MRDKAAFRLDEPTAFSVKGQKVDATAVVCHPSWDMSQYKVVLTFPRLRGTVSRISSDKIEYCKSGPKSGRSLWEVRRVVKMFHSTVLVQFVRLNRRSFARFRVHLLNTEAR